MKTFILNPFDVHNLAWNSAWYNLAWNSAWYIRSRLRLPDTTATTTMAEEEEGTTTLPPATLLLVPAGE